MPVTSEALQAADLGAQAQAVADPSVLESSFREMLDLLPAAIYITDANGRVTYFNPACESLSGRTPELGSDQWYVTWKLHYPDGTPMPHGACPMAVSLREGRAVRGEQAIAERPDGTRIWFEPYPTPLFDSHGKVIGGINMLVEITGLTGHLPVRSYLAVPVVSSSGQVLGGLFFAHPEPGVFTERSERIVAGIAVHAGIAMDNARLFDDAQREIAERKRIAEALREREHQFAGIFNQTTCGIAQTDLTGRFVLVNDRYCDIVGRPREELLSLGMHDITHPDDLVDNAGQFRALVEQNGPNYEVEKRYLRPDGSSVWVHNDVAAIRDEEGRVRYLAAAVTDITERKHAEDQLRRNADELARFNRIAVGRELRMIDLKKEINDLREQLGQDPRFPLQFEKDAETGNG